MGPNYIRFQDRMKIDSLDIFSYLLCVLLRHNFMVVLKNFSMFDQETLDVGIELVRLVEKSLENFDP